MFSSARGIAIHGGTFNSTNVNQTARTSRGIDLLLEWVATGAFHDSDELYDAPKCHPHTRVAVLDDIMRWVGESESVRDDFMLWLFGPAGAGKSAIAKRIAEIAAAKGMLIGSFFFSRTSMTPGRGTKDRFVATLAYQLALSVPDTRIHIEDAIERDPTIFRRNIQTQIDTLLIKPYQIARTQLVPLPKLIVIDGVDECHDSQAQVAILDAISSSFSEHSLPVIFLVVSRPEPDLVTSFNTNEPLKLVHRRLPLDNTYRPDNDIRIFFSDKFEHIRRTHRLRSTIPGSWPTQESLEMLVEKSSGQFAYAATVVRFVQSNRHRPTARLDIILGITPPGNMNPFAELDALYNHVFSSVDDIQLTLLVLGFYVVTPSQVLARRLRRVSMSPEMFLSLESGDIYLALMNLSSVILCDESSGAVKILHASLVDFLFDKRRSTTFYLDMASTCTDFTRRIFQFVKGGGIRAGDLDLFCGVIDLRRWVIQSELRSEILNFDLDEFITAVIRQHYNRTTSLTRPVAGSPTITSFRVWMSILDTADFEGREKGEALDRCTKSFESRLQIYQSGRQLQLLVILAAASIVDVSYGLMEGAYGVESCRRMDILLQMDDHDLHLIDQNALDLRHWHASSSPPALTSIMSRYVDSHGYASAALYCMSLLSNPPKYVMRNDSLEMGLTYLEWKATCDMTLHMMCTLLQEANTSPELVQFLSSHDIDQAVQDFNADQVWWVDVHILAFLSRAGVCVNWRIISGIRRAKAGESLSENDLRPGEEEDWEVTRRSRRQRLAQCCVKGHFQYD